MKTFNDQVNKTLLIQIVVYVAILIGSIVAFKNVSLQSPNWIYPYFSGAEHLDSSLKWQYSWDGYQRFRNLSNFQMFAYDFTKENKNDLIEYTYNDIGYVFVIWAAKTIFPFLTHINATVVLQCLIHGAITLAVAFSFERPFYRVLFLLAYGANPLVIHFVTLPSYYFWQVLPSLLFLLLLRNSDRGKLFFLLVFVTLFFSYLVRSSTLPLVMFIALFTLVKVQKTARLFHVTMILVLVFAISSAAQHKQPWHTMYVGLGAYENNYMDGPTDENGFLLYKQEKNVEISTALGGNFYNREVETDYYKTLKKRYLEILKTDQYLVIRNALLNLAQSFSIGYLVDYPKLRVHSILAGLLVLSVFLYSRQFVLVLGILASSIGFVLYFPPIPAYMFGSYLLMVYGAIESWSRLIGQKSGVDK